MNEHDELEPTVAMPRVAGVPAAADSLPLRPEPPAPAREDAAARPPRQPVLPQPVVSPSAGSAALQRRTYVFGNPFTYVLRRLCAFAVDFVVLTTVATMLLYGLIAINPLSGLPNNSEGGFDATVATGAGIAFVSIWLLEATVGTTLGKLAFALHVYVPKRRFVGLSRALLRNLLRPLDLLIVGGLLALAPGHRRLGDLLGGTLVARSPLRAFAPLLGWLLIAALAALPFFVAGGTVTIFAVGAAFVEFIPPLIGRLVHAVLQLIGSPSVHLPRSAG